MGTIYSIFVTCIVLEIVSLALVLFGDKSHRPIGWVGLVLAFIGFVWSFYILVSPAFR